MVAEPFSEALQGLLRDRLTSFEQLDIVLLVRRRPTENWTAAALGETLRMPQDLIEAALDGLVSNGLVSRLPASNACQFSPATPALAGAVEELASAYQSESAAVLRAMSENAIARIRSGPMRAFADAFVFRKGKDDG